LVGSIRHKGGRLMGFFDGVRECNQANGGVHKWSPPQDSGVGRLRWFARCEGDCEVKVHGQTPAQAMAEAQELDRANRRWRLW
jgi:hypothetical protein